MTRVMDIEDRCRNVVQNRSITFMGMRRETGGATSLPSRIMMLATNMAQDTQAAGGLANTDNLSRVPDRTPFWFKQKARPPIEKAGSCIFGSFVGRYELGCFLSFSS